MESFWSENIGESSCKHTPLVPEKEFYQPRTEDTHEAYQALLTIIEYQVGVRSDHAMLCVAAEEILSVLKSSESINNPIYQKLQVEKILNPIPDVIFEQLVCIAEVITDYSHVTAPAEKGFYQPRSEDTWTAYTSLLDVIESCIGYRPLFNQCMVAHEILSIMNAGKLDFYEEKTRIESYLNVISFDTFDYLLYLGRLIWDFDEFKFEGGILAHEKEVNDDWESHQKVANKGVEGLVEKEVIEGEEEEEDVNGGIELDKTVIDGADMSDRFDGQDVDYKEEEEKKECDLVQVEEEEEKKECDLVQVEEEEEKKEYDLAQVVEEDKEEEEKKECEVVQVEEEEDEEWEIVDFPANDSFVSLVIV